MSAWPLLLLLWPGQTVQAGSMQEAGTVLPSVELLEYIGAMEETESGQLIDPLSLLDHEPHEQASAPDASPVSRPQEYGDENP